MQRAGVYDANYYSSCNNQYREGRRFQIAAFGRAALIKLIFNPASALDVGCGMGILVEKLQRLGIKARGVDVSKYALSQVPSKFKRLCREGNILKLDFPPRSFDLVASVNVLEHQEEKDVELAISNCARVAGRVMYHEITVSEDITVINKDPTHKTKRPADWWEGKFRQLLSREWKIRRVWPIPFFKNGIFLLEKV